MIYARRITSALEADQAEAGRLNVDGSLAEVPICMGAERPLERQLKLQKFDRGINFRHLTNFSNPRLREAMRLSMLALGMTSGHI